MDLFSGILILVLTLFLVYQFYLKISYIKLLEGRIEEYYTEKELDLKSVSKLNITEKIKYAVPISPFVKLYSTTFGFFKSSEESVFRKLDTIDRAGNEQIRYIEIITVKGTISIKEFDIFEFDLSFDEELT